MLRYLARLSASRVVLWCYLCWYVSIVWLYFDPRPELWLSSLGMSAIIGTGLWLSTSTRSHRPSGWTVFRLYLTPFCVSSYSALVVGKGFFLIFPPRSSECLIGFGSCAAFYVLHRILKGLLCSRNSALKLNFSELKFSADRSE